MTVHLVVLTSILILGFLFFGTKNGGSIKRKKQFVVTAELILFLAIGLRAVSVGLDTKVYYAYFNRFGSGITFVNRMGWEPLYVLLMRIGAYFNSFQVVMLLCSAITCIGFGTFIYYNSKTNWIAFWYIFFYITLNLYFNSMHLMRQICAMAVAINVYTILSRDKSRKSLIKTAFLIIIATMFHITAPIFMIPVVFALIIENVDRRVLMLGFISAVVGSMFLTVGQNLILNIVDRFSRYAGDERLQTGNFGIYALAIILIKIVMTVCVMTLDSSKPENRELYRLTFINVVATVFFCLQTRTQFALRIGYWYEMYFPLYLPVFIERFKIRSTRRLLYSIFFLFGVVYFIYMMKFGGTKSNRGTVPYLFYWQATE